jgi:hypothetical protein
VRLVEEKMDVLGHEDVRKDRELVGATGSFENLLEDVFGFGVFEVGGSVVTTEGDEVELAGVLATFETERHDRILSLGEEDGSRSRANAHSCDETA